VASFMSAKMRRKLRRDAARLRRGQTEPRYKNLHTAEELAAVYERTVQRDELYEQTVRDYKRIARDLSRILEDPPPDLYEAMKTHALEAQRSAEEQGPWSEAARRWWHIQHLVWLRLQQHTPKRRQTAPVPQRVALADPSVQARLEQSAAELLPSSDGRLSIRIGTGDASWIGSFERGRTKVSTVAMLPDGKHLFVCAAGAGYVIDAKSQTIVETTGTEIVGVMGDKPFTLYVVNHNGMSLEAFGRTGRLWKTGPIGLGGLRRMALTNDALVGETRHLTPVGWARFSVRLATGEVEIGPRDVIL